MDNLHGPNFHRLEPQWRGESYNLVAVQKSASTQYGSVPIEFAGVEMRISLGYRRYRYCDKSDEPGQDFAIACWDRQYLVGVLADGVSQSFYGNLAAGHVCSWLLPQLWQRRADPPEESELEAGLKQAERDFAGIIEGVSLDHVADFLRPALEATRRTGSQAVFAAFVWEFTKQRGCLYQVGDAIAIVQRNDHPEKIEAPPRGRWSSAGKSELLLRRTLLRETTAILLKSDGADPNWGCEIARQTASDSEFLEMANRRAENDDVSFVAGCLVTESLAPPKEQELPFYERPHSPAPRSNLSIYLSKPANAGEPSNPLEVPGGDAGEVFTAGPDRANAGESRRPARWWRDAGCFVAGFLLAAVLGVHRPPAPSRQPAAVKTSVARNAAKAPADSGAPALPASTATLPVQERALAATDTNPPQAKEFLIEHPDGVVFGIQAGKVAISGLNITGIEWSSAVPAGASGDRNLYVFFPQLQSDVARASRGRGRLRREVTVELYHLEPGGQRKTVLKRTIQLEAEKRYYDISIPSGGAR
jgi:hypothetical protein